MNEPNLNILSTQLLNSLFRKGLTANEVTAVLSSAVAMSNCLQDEYSYGPTAGEPAMIHEIVIHSFGDSKIKVIKALRNSFPRLGLREAKDMSEGKGYVFAEGSLDLIMQLKDQLAKSSPGSRFTVNKTNQEDPPNGVSRCQTVVGKYNYSPDLDTIDSYMRTYG